MSSQRTVVVVLLSVLIIATSLFNMFRYLQIEFMWKCDKNQLITVLFSRKIANNSPCRCHNAYPAYERPTHNVSIGR